MPRLPECSTTHTRPRSSTHSSKKWLPEPSVPNCLATFVACSSASSVAGLCAASHRSALRADHVVALADTGRDRLLDAAEQRLERVGQLVLGDVELGGDHAAADVDADRRGDHRALGRDHRADRGADADVGVGHEGDVALHDRQASGLLGLADGPRVDVARPGDELVVDVGGHVTPSLSCWCGVAGGSRTRITSVACSHPRRWTTTTWSASRDASILGHGRCAARGGLEPPQSE